MAKESFISKTVAITFVVMTCSVIAGMITMIILYKTQISELNPTPRPTFSTTTTGPPPVMRLPKYLVPETYTVYLQPHLYTKIIEKVNVTSPNQTLLFTGNSTVVFHCVQTTRAIYLHSKDLTIMDSSVVSLKDNARLKINEMKHHEDVSDFLEIQLNEALEKGKNYSLFLSFQGEMSQSLDGLYLSSYHADVAAEEGDSRERFLAATNMEPTETRRVFPCFDEPEMKAVFHVTIVHRIGTRALGNEQKSVSNMLDDYWQYTKFNPTPKMSTYLFAFVVSEFEQSSSSPHDRVDIQTFARPEAIKARHADYAASITGKILSFYEKYLEINYQQKTLDQIALPDLAPAAMENWGLVTYQEGALLYEEGVSSLLEKEWIATLIAHELAHQWFGNLVTMKWWNQIWLNEGFATYMATIAVEHVEPMFQMTDVFVMRDFQQAFEEDALASSHPLNVPEQEIQTSSAIIGMFDSITYSKGALVLRMLAGLVGKTTFHNGVKIYLRDFMYKNADQNDLWDSIQKAVEMDNGHTEVAKVMEPWTNQIGYPVITINTTNGEIYQKQFLFNDTAESEAKLANVTLALNLTRFLRNETAYIPWESAIRNLKYFDLMFDRSEAYLREQVTDLYKYFRNYTDSSTVPEDHSLQHSQILAIDVACSNGLPECISMASKMYANWMKINGTNTYVLYTLWTPVAAGGKKEWEFAWDKFQSTTDTSEKDQLRSALACTKKIWLLNRYLEYTLDPEKIRLMEVASTIYYIARNVAGQALTWNFIRAHWDYVSEGDAASLISGVTSRFSTQFELEELERFSTDYILGSADRAVNQAIEQTQVNIQWVAEHKDVILEWFEAQTA
ncbi:Aminopeptidase N [Collichthys lucidus]|uniref:Aminopeptidase n=1 Tax=Collichthys lucidus TaxID=240159 RepID=A0A4U5UEJ8_COLLU|nr:Aminopeptidase N [Collichthys lucidus]